MLIKLRELILALWAILSMRNAKNKNLKKCKP